VALVRGSLVVIAAVVVVAAADADVASRMWQAVGLRG
jgi:hypothetical protein